jgi:sugar phosphate isomerase/epimerase
MRLGISSWTYPWAIEVSGFPLPARPMRIADLLDRAAVLKVGVVQVADNLPLHELDPSEIRDARDQAVSLGLGIEIGTRGVEPAHLLRYLSLAVTFDATLLRTLTHSVKQQPSLDQAEKWIREVLPGFEAQGVTLGLENYEKHSCRDLADLVRRLGSSHVGICLDTVNSLGALETPEVVVETLAPLTVNLHIKDFVIERVPQMMGFVVSGAPAGAGKLAIPWLLEQMPADNDVSAILEQWPPLRESAEATVAMEQEWAERGVQYLRSCACVPKRSLERTRALVWAANFHLRNKKAKGDPYVSGITTDAEPQLRRNSLGLPELVFHAVTHIAPATSVVLIFPAIAHQAGPAMPLSFVLTTIVCMFVGSTVFQFSKYVPSSGGY